MRESWTDAFSLTVNPSQPVVLSPFQAIDVTGTIQVSANGKRTLNATSVQVYTDSTGNTILTPMLVRTENGVILPWQWRNDAPLFQMAAPSGMYGSMNAPPPPGTGEESEPTESVPEAGTIAYAKTIIPGANVTLNGKILTRKFPAAGYFYIQEPMPKREGIRVIGSTTHEPGTILNISGVTQLAADGEKEIINPTIALCTSCTGSVGPVNVINRSLNFEGLVVNQTGFDLALGATNGNGTNLAGTLVHTAGRVTSVDSLWFRVNDGSMTEDLRVEAPEGYFGHTVGTGQYFRVTGIAGLRDDGNDYKPVVRMNTTGTGLMNICHDLVISPIEPFDLCDPLSAARPFRIDVLKDCEPVVGAGIYLTTENAEVSLNDGQSWLSSADNTLSDSNGFILGLVRSTTGTGSGKLNASWNSEGITRQQSF